MHGGSAVHQDYVLVEQVHRLTLRSQQRSFALKQYSILSIKNEKGRTRKVYRLAD